MKPISENHLFGDEPFPTHQEYALPTGNVIRNIVFSCFDIITMLKRNRMTSSFWVTSKVALGAFRREKLELDRSNLSLKIPICSEAFFAAIPEI